jgi:transcriptional regulator with XRE-family HTH domain
LSDQPHPTDVHVGRRIRLRRRAEGLSQERLADGLGLTFQQVQKYERGANRVGSSRIYDLSRVLDVPITYFFDEMPTNVQDKSPSRLMGLATPPTVDYEPDPMAKRETLELVRAYYRISEAAVRKRLFELIKSIARGLRDEE